MFFLRKMLWKRDQNQVETILLAYELIRMIPVLLEHNYFKNNRVASDFDIQK